MLNESFQETSLLMYNYIHFPHVLDKGLHLSLYCLGNMKTFMLDPAYIHSQDP